MKGAVRVSFFVLLHTASCGSPIPRAAVTPATVDQDAINRGDYADDVLFAVGERLFDARWSCDQGGGTRRDGTCTYDRQHGPESLTCVKCHNSPVDDGGGTLSTNVFRLHDLATGQFVERNPPHLFGAGYLQLLAAEMTRDLQSQRAQALASAKRNGMAVTVTLRTKDLDFGKLEAQPDGTATYQGAAVHSDLVVRPFMAKGQESTIRGQNLGAIVGHLGIQPVELVGSGTDPDLDGFTDEMTIGQVSALVAYQSMLPMPSFVAHSSQAVSGREVFDKVGCASCHTPTLQLDDPTYFLADPRDGGQGVAIDLPSAGLPPRTQRLGPLGPVLLPLFSDLRRHDVGPALADFRDTPILSSPLASAPPVGSPDLDKLPLIPKSHFVTARLWGVGSTAPYLHHGHAFDLNAAILAHAGDATDSRTQYEQLSQVDRSKLIDFLRSLVLVRGSPSGTTTSGGS